MCPSTQPGCHLPHQRLPGPTGQRAFSPWAPFPPLLGGRGGIPDCVALTCVPSTCPPVPRLSCHLCPSLPGRQNERLREGKNALQPYSPHSSRGCRAVAPGALRAPPCPPHLAVTPPSPPRSWPPGLRWAHRPRTSHF